MQWMPMNTRMYIYICMCLCVCLRMYWIKSDHSPACIRNHIRLKSHTWAIHVWIHAYTHTRILIHFTYAHAYMQRVCVRAIKQLFIRLYFNVTLHTFCCCRNFVEQINLFVDMCRFNCCRCCYCWLTYECV